MARRSRRLMNQFRTEWMLIVGCALIVVFGIGVTREMLRRRAVDTEVARLQSSVEQLQNRKTELLELLAEFQQASVQEREARTKLGLVRPGEKTLIVESEPATTTVATTSTPVTSAGSNPRQWWRYFFGS